MNITHFNYVCGNSRPSWNEKCSKQDYSLRQTPQLKKQILKARLVAYTYNDNPWDVEAGDLGEFKTTPSVQQVQGQPGPVILPQKYNQSKHKQLPC